MPIPVVKKPGPKEVTPLHSFWEYQSALRVLAALEAQIRSNKASDVDRKFLHEHLERIELFETENNIRQPLRNIQ